jgi:hypothetical protein
MVEVTDSQPGRRYGRRLDYAMHSTVPIVAVMRRTCAFASPDSQGLPAKAKAKPHSRGKGKEACEREGSSLRCSTLIPTRST